MRNLNGALNVRRSKRSEVNFRETTPQELDLLKILVYRKPSRNKLQYTCRIQTIVIHRAYEREGSSDFFITSGSFEAPGYFLDQRFGLTIQDCKAVIELCYLHDLLQLTERYQHSGHAGCRTDNAFYYVYRPRNDYYIFRFSYSLNGTAKFLQIKNTLAPSHL